MQLLYDTCILKHVREFKYINFYKGVIMNQQELQKLDELTLDLNMDLCILKSAIICFDDDLKTSDLVNFVQKLYKISNEIRDIFYNSSA